MKNRGTMAKSGPKKLMKRGNTKTKSRKELRKDKRQQKKINRFNWHSKKKSDRIKERQQQKKTDPLDDNTDIEDDEEIPSDFDDSDEEGVSTSAPIPGLNQLERDRQKEIKELQSYEDGLKNKRIDQLKAANDEDDMIIRKYEKLLNINRRKSKDGLPKSFDDGLDYALELCTPENIQKMYDAAKEADNLFENNSEDEFIEDLGAVIDSGPNEKQKLNSKCSSDKSKNKVEKLKAVEKKYFGDDMDSLDGFDSEMDDDIIEEDEDFESYDEEADNIDYGEEKSSKKVKFTGESDENGSDLESDEDLEDDYLSDENAVYEKLHVLKNKKGVKKNDSKKSKFMAEKIKNEINVEDSDSNEAEVFQNLAELKRKKKFDGSEEPRKKQKKINDTTTGDNLDNDETRIFEKLSELKVKKNKKGDQKFKKKTINEENYDSDEVKVFEKLANLKKNKNKKEIFGKGNPVKLTKELRNKSKNKIEEKYDSDEAEVFEKLKKLKKLKNVDKKGKQKSEESDLEDEFDQEENFDDNCDSEDEKSVFAKLAALKSKNNKSDAKTDTEWEDIYGRKRDKQGNILNGSSGLYVPPHLRAKLSQTIDDPKKSEKLIRLKKILKGHINRLSELNMHKIFNEIDNLYMQNARFDMNTTVTELILEAIVLNVLSPERMVLEHVLLIAVLHANIGQEVGARFLETVIGKFIDLLGNIHSLAVEDKEMDNLVLILCHMYTFQIFKHKLIYDILYRMVDHFNEKSVECILLILKSIGFVLRKDDPLLLKDFIIAVQKKANNSTEELKNDSRVKFMLDILLAVKNNNMNKIPQYDPTLVEHIKKNLKGMITSGKYISSLNISLDDLTNVDERGKWWLVGSAWTGNSEKQSNQYQLSVEGMFSQKLLELAKKQRMNTDDRKNVFCIIMSAEDYIDAFGKILTLSIKDQKVIVSVILHCMLAEKDSNPYYSILGQKFCDHDRKYQLAFQFALWDKFKVLNSLNSNQIRNLAKFLIYLIGQGGLPLSVLKVIEFSELDKTTLRLVRQIMMGLILEKGDVFQQVFNRVSPSLKLKGFKDSLRLFLHHFLLKSSGKGNIPEEQLDLLKQRIKEVDKCFETI